MFEVRSRDATAALDSAAPFSISETSQYVSSAMTATALNPPKAITSQFNTLLVSGGTAQPHHVPSRVLYPAGAPDRIRQKRE